MEETNKNEQGWKYGGGRNGKHIRLCPAAALRARLLEIDLEITTIRNRPYRNCKQDRLALERERRHVQQLLAKRGEEHSRKAKGFSPPSLR